MKYLRSLMQQSVTACKNQAKLIQQFTLSLLYLLEEFYKLKYCSTVVYMVPRA